MTKESWLALGIDPDKKSVTILGTVGTVENEFAAKQMGILGANERNLNPDNNLVINIAQPSAVVRPAMLSWMHRFNIPEYQAVPILQALAKTILERMQANKPQPVKWKG